MLMDRRRFLALLGVAPVLVACDPVRGISQVSPGSHGGGDVDVLTGAASVFVAEDWHSVGDSGEPAYENSWDGGGFSVARFRLRGAGVVDLRLVVFGGTPGAVIFTLPEGYRPTGNVKMPVTGEIGTTMSAGLLAIAPDGTVYGDRDSSADHEQIFAMGLFYLDSF